MNFDFLIARPVDFMLSVAKGIFLSSTLLLVTFYSIAADPDLTEPQEKKPETVFVINNAIIDLKEFEQLVKSAAQLKPYGRVQINISTLAERSSYELPDGRSPWYDYASYNSTPYKFFPHRDLAPYIPADHVEKNRKLLLAKVKMLRAHGLEAAFFGSEPNFLPRAFFEKHPDFLGPRVDHPRRSNDAAFAPCVSRPEVRAMYSDMMAEMLKHAPEIKTFYFKTNDAGTGICWGDWLYTGPNGPTYCKHLTMGDRMVDLMSALSDGAKKANTELDIFLAEHQGAANFSEEERKNIQTNLPEHAHFMSTDKDVMVYPSSGLVEHYPIRGIIDPFEFINSLNPPAKTQAETYTVFVNFRSWYSRGNEHVAGMKLSLEMVEEYMSALQQGKSTETAVLVRQLAQKWAGSSADALYAAFDELHKTFTASKKSIGNLKPINWNVAARLINRPLLAAPQRLTPEEEAYFLPHVFNVSEEEARMDYRDIQGGRWSADGDSARMYGDKLVAIAARFAALPKNIKERTLREDVPLALRMRGSFLKSCANFSDAQVLRDNNHEVLSGDGSRPSKEPTWSGNKDLLAFNAIMRAELDNTQELIKALEEGGLALISRAPSATYEDTFILSPDLIDQVKKKRKIMLDHWRDIEYYMTTPFK